VTSYLPRLIIYHVLLCVLISYLEVNVPLGIEIFVVHLNYLGTFTPVTPDLRKSVVKFMWMNGCMAASFNKEYFKFDGFAHDLGEAKLIW